MAEDGWVSAGPRARRLPPAGKPAPEPERDDAAPRGVGLGTLAVSMVARGDVADRVRWRRFYEATAAVVGLVFALLVMFVLWLWYVPPAVPVPTLPEDVAVELAAVKLDESIRVRRPVVMAAAPTARAAAAGPATINLPEGHEILSWRLDCATVGVASGGVPRGARVITIPNVPPHGCRAVLTSPSANVPVENLVAGSRKTCAKSPTMRCR